MQGLAHGVTQGGISALQGGDFWSGFASGTLSSWASSGYELSGLGKSLGVGGMYGFGVLSGGVGAAVTGGNFWQGAATGLVVSALNHGKHKAESAQEQKQFQKALEKYRKLIDEVNNLVSPSIDLANKLTRNEIKMLARAGVLTDIAGAAVFISDGYLAYSAWKNGEPWGWHAYDMAIGGIGMIGLPEAMAATSINATVKGTLFLDNVVNTINVKGPKWFTRDLMWKLGGMY